ncbi:arabinosyltransferase domain-containing protein [Saccharomonospora piscinae]|uniref:arabinosyltransferase domain-containing protein n=1 Tax=Saccharomonospora piscinae TaxID=687388 RepID=UPI0004642FEC|nr:arabinosyltransferase domain-containing protein [Saccharomonospora piscinae]
MTFRVWLITMCALLSAVTAGLFVLAPVDQQSTRYSWPDGEVENRTLPLFPYEPHRLDVTFGCADVRSADEDLLLSTTAPRNAPVENGADGGLDIRASPNTVTVSVGDREVITSSVESACAWSVTSQETGTTVRRDGEVVAHTIEIPVVTGMFTEAPAQTGLRATVVPDTRYESTPGAARIALAAVTVAALAAMFVLLARTTLSGQRRVRVLPPRWWRPRPADAAVACVLAGWLVVGAPTVDDGYIVTMLKAAGDGDVVGNYFRWFNAPEAPFSWFYELYRGVAEVSGAAWWLRLPSVLLGLLLWVLVDRLLLPRLVPRATPLTRFAAAATFALWYVQFGVGLRPEPWVMLGVVAVFLLVERTVVTRSLGALGASVAVAGATVAVTPTGVVALAPFVAAAPGLARVVRLHGVRVLPVVLGSGAAALLLMFADQSLASVLHSTEVRTTIGPSFGVLDEPMRYDALLDPIQGGLNRRMPLVLLWFCLAVLIALLVARRVPGLAARPTRRAVLVSLLFFVALAFTPTKYTHHFGALGGLAAVLLAAVVHTVRTGALRPGWARSLFVLAAGAVSAYGLAAPLRWWFLAGTGTPWSLEPPDIGIPLGEAVFAGGVLLAVLGLVVGWRRLPSPAWVLPCVVTGVVALEVLSVTYPALARPGAYSVARATLDPGGCGVERWLTVEPEPGTGLLRPVTGSSEVRADGFRRGAYPPQAPPPPGYGEGGAPVWGSDGARGTLTTPWSTVPDGAASPDSPPLVVPVAGTGAVAATAQFADRDGTVTREVRLRLGGGTWREARLDPGSADRVRLVVSDAGDGQGWVAVGAARLPRVVPLPEYLPVSRPVALDWVSAFSLPCRSPAAVAHGVTEPVGHLVGAGPDSRWLAGMSTARAAGGPYAPLLAVARQVPVPTYLRGDKLSEPISVFRFDYVAPPLPGVPG